MRPLLRKPIALFMAGLFFFVLIAGLVVFFAPMGPVLSFWVEKQIEQMADAEVTVEGLDFRLYEGMYAKRVTIHSADFPGESIQLSDISVKHRVGALLKGRYRIRSVSIGNMDVTATDNFFKWASALGSGDDLPGVFPEVTIGGGRIRVGLPDYFEPISFERIQGSARQEKGGQISGSVSFRAGRNDVNIRFDADREHGFVKTDLLINGLDLSFLPVMAVAGVDIDPSGIKSSGVLSGTMTYLASSGEWLGDLSLTGVTAGHAATGLVVTNARTEIQIADREIVFHDGRIHAADGYVAMPRAVMRLGENAIEEFRFYGNATGLHLDRLEEIGLFKFLPEGFRPGRMDSGEIDAAVRATWQHDDGVDYHADIEISDASGMLTSPELDFSLFEAKAVMQTGGNVTVENAIAHFWDGRAEVAGMFDISEKGMANPDLDINFEDVVKNEALMAMLPEGVQEGIAFAGPSNAKVGGNITLTGEAVSLDLNVDAEMVSPEALPFVLSGATGNIKWSSDASRVLFDDVSGEIDGSPLRGFGALVIEDEMTSDFTVYAEDIRLDEGVLAWLNMDIGRWGIEGRFDLALQARDWQPVEKSVIRSLSGISAEMTLKDVALSHADYGRVAQSLSGRLDLGEGGIELAHFNGAVYGVTVNGNGRFPWTYKKTNPHLVINAEAFRLSPELFGRLPFETGLEGTDIDGSASLFGRIDAHVDADMTFTGDVSATLDDVKITYGGTPLGLSGVLGVRFSEDRINGSINLDDIMAGDFTGEHLAADFTYKPPAIDFRNMVLQAYGGRIDSEKTRVDTAEKTWETEFDIAGMDLEKVAQSYEVMGKQVLAGELKSSVSLQGRSSDTQSITGGGDLAIDNGRLYSFPILVAVLGLFDLKIPTQNPVTDAYGVFSIENGVITVENLLFTGGSLPVYMEGYIGMQNNIPLKNQAIYMIVTLPGNESFLDRIPLVSLFKHHTIDFLRRVVLQAQITGSFGDYRVSTISSPFTSQIEKMWQYLQNMTPSSAEKIDDLF